MHLGACYWSFSWKKKMKVMLMGEERRRKGKKGSWKEMGILVRLGDRSSSVHEEISKVIRGQFLFMSIDLAINY